MNTKIKLTPLASVAPAAACSLIAAGATNIMCDGTTMGPHAHTMLFQNLRGEFGKDARDPSWFNAGFPFRIWRESGLGYALGRNRPCHTLDGQARTPEEAVEMAGSDGVIVTANVDVMARRAQDPENFNP